MAVEKVRFPEIRLKMGDQKCIRGRRKSFIGHPSARRFFGVISGREFFNTHKRFHSNPSPSICQANRRSKTSPENPRRAWSPFGATAENAFKR